MILGAAALAPLLALLLWRTTPPGAIALLFVSHVSLLYATLKPTCQWLGPVVTRFRTTRKEVWLTIDDGPGNETARFLDLLEAHGARATFFVTGMHVCERPELLRSVSARGHQIANHSYSHPSGTFWCLSASRIASEIDRCTEAIERATGMSTRLFRAPVGFKNFFVHPLLARRRMRLIGWSSRGFDAVDNMPARSAARILDSTRPGAILLLHERHFGSETSPTVECLTRVLGGLAEQGYACVIPDEESLVSD